MTPYHHAVNSALKWGGNPREYLFIHDWFDCTKAFTGDWTHRCLRHHAAGIQWMVEEFGHTFTNSEGRAVPIKIVGEQHVTEDCGFVPTVADWLKCMKEHPAEWMLKVKTKSEQTMEVK